MSLETRTVASRMVLRAESETAFVLAAAVAQGHQVADEQLRIELDGVAVPHSELADEHGGRLQLFGTGAGTVSIDYRATVHGRPLAAPVEQLDTVRYVRPSRYCESDSLTPFAREHFSGLAGAELAFTVTEWVYRRLAYVSGSSLPTDGALATLEQGEGVCRDFAHLTAALMRALDMPARLVAVYAPGLAPMDFHAVVEAMIEGRWYVFDATHLAPRRSMVRISTGRDAADTAFLSNTISDIVLEQLEVFAVAEVLPDDVWTELVELS